MRESILTLKRPARETKSAVLSCPHNPGATFPINVKQLSFSEFMAAGQKAYAYALRYVLGSPLKADGTPDTENPKYTPPEPLPPIDGQQVIVTEAAIQMLARVEFAQTGDDRYSIEDLLGLATSDAMCMQLQELDEWIATETVVRQESPGNE